MQQKIPEALNFHRQSQRLELKYGGDESYQLSSEMLRVHSPSAEVRGHGTPVLQTGKKQVQVTNIEKVGHYAIKIHFSDGHDSGIYDWGYLYDLCVNQEAYWEAYLENLHQAGESREPDADVVKLMIS
ncbi:gamma-butyrobetaine hydroxylase-like domain-containing protein [Endozoicomonas sp. ALD040]|uniref:gamma-butyrobetaine hydroxylase-like domain-containing protein n=1 Tax=unclassified Endozoicomonas TaxID=2644528 RepID=UPI003BB14095